MFNYRLFYRRNLPHYQPEDATLFVTFRLAGSIPVRVVRELAETHANVLSDLRALPDSPEKSLRLSEEQSRAFGRWDAALHHLDCGPRWLETPEIAAMVADSLRFRHEKVYLLRAYCIMPNHVHVVFTPLPTGDGEFHSLAKIMHSLKLRTASEANRRLKIQGEFWQHENYDHVVRDEAEYGRIIEYVLNNPVKAGLVAEWQAWPWSYVDRSVLSAS
jgi:REP element-mobilizing transposase RayT